MHFIYVIYYTCMITSAVEQGHSRQSEHGKAKIPTCVQQGQQSSWERQSRAMATTKMA